MPLLHARMDKAQQVDKVGEVLETEDGNWFAVAEVQQLVASLMTTEWLKT
jgi:NAD-dependent DNA ligase